MLFNSYIFILVFLPLVLAAWWSLARWPQIRLGFLVASSYLFYGWWHWEFTLLLLASTLIDYYVGLGIFLAQSTVAKLAGPLLAQPEHLQFVSGWAALIAYTVQLYFDFAGYSNMAIGLGLMLGFSFPQNFDSPYQATSIQSFWRRWHMTLSSFLRDYLYIPLGGSRYGKLFSYRNLLVVMLLGGFWHGAGWTFILWGLMHGSLLVCNGIYRDYIKISIPKTVGMAFTFFFVMMGWLLFRSTDLAMAQNWYAAIFGFHGVEPDFGRGVLQTTGFFVAIGSLLFCWLAPNTWNYKPRLSLGTALVLSLLLVVCILRFDAESPFLYFQF